MNQILKTKGETKMIINTKDRILLRRLVNQHNIDCLTEGKPSEYCNAGITHCSVEIDPFKEEIICNRCDHRDDMEHNPSSAFIGFTLQPPKRIK